MFQTRKFYKFFSYQKSLALAIIACLLSLSTLSGSASNIQTYKTYAEVSPYYSSTEPIVYQTLSSNGEQLLFCIQGQQQKQLAVYLAQSNGTRLFKVFSSAYYSVGNEEIYFAPINSPPAISGNGEIVALGVRASLDISRRNDWIMVYNTKTQRRIFVQLRQLISGTNYAKLPETNFKQTILSMDFEGKYLVCQIEIGLDTPSCKSYDTALLFSNIDGSNQQILVGPEDFSRPTCSFRWKDYPKSPHQPMLTYKGDRVVFYGQVFGAQDPYDQNGEIFVINTNKSNLRQLSHLRREETKLEALGPFCLNYYGSRIFFKHHIQDQYYLSSVSIDGGLIQNHVTIDKVANFAISGDGRRLFFIDSKHDHSLVYFDISREMVTLVLDKSWSGSPYSYPILDQLNPKSISKSSVTAFDGKKLFIFVQSGSNTWLCSISMDSNLLTPQKTIMSFEINKTVFVVNDRRISLDTPAYIKNQRVMLPLDLIAEHFGYKLFINPDQSQAQLRLNGNILVLNKSNSKGFWNGKSITVQPPMELKGRSLFFPASLLRDQMGLKLNWDNQLQTLQVLRTATP
jgi:hypothetical protein